jgi:hypothetical protein
MVDLGSKEGLTPETLLAKIEVCVLQVLTTNLDEHPNEK